MKAQSTAALAQVRGQTLSKRRGRRCICRRICVRNILAVEEADWFAEDDRDDDEGKEYGAIKASHHEKSKVGASVEEGDADEAVQRSEASLWRISIKVFSHGHHSQLTIVNVPTTSLGGSTLVLTISEMKFAVSPTMQTIARRERPRTSTKVLAKGAAP